jgi:Nucleoside 2-deoxyribosyltransferase like
VSVEQAAAAHRYVEAPEDYRGGGPSIFLAGGITDCPDWQADAVRMLAGVPVTILNPRRRHFDTDDPTAAEAQIRWEHTHLDRAAVVLFWFTAGPSPQPIALYELGRLADTGRPIAVGADPGYRRRADVRMQLALSRPGLVVRSDLAGTVAAAVAGLPGGLPR